MILLVLYINLKFSPVTYSMRSVVYSYNKEQEISLLCPLGLEDDLMSILSKEKAAVTRLAYNQQIWDTSIMFS